MGNFAQDFTFLGINLDSNKDIGIAKSFPGIEYLAQENGGIYHEDREVSGELWRVQNATYNNFSQQWLQVDPTQPSRAFVIAQGGKMTMRFSPAGTQPCIWSDKWYVNDSGVASFSVFNVSSLPATVDLSDIGIYNVGFFGMTTSDLVGTINTAALQAAVNAAAANGGGTVYIPTGLYVLNGTINIGSGNAIAIVGESNGSTLHQEASGNTFTVSGNQAGTLFQDLHITYDIGLSGSAIRFSQCADVHVIRVYMNECFNGVNFVDTVKAVMEDCFCTNVSQNNANAIQITGTGPGSGTGSTVYINNCHFTSGASFSVGLYMQQASNCVISNCSFNNFFTGIQLTSSVAGANCVGNYFENVQVLGSGNYGVIITPAFGSGALIQNQTFSHCQFSNGAFGIYVDTNGQANSTVDTINFYGCQCFNNVGAGLQINAGRHIHVDGGDYSSNSNIIGFTGNIIITGPATDVMIVGTSCVGSAFSLPASQYGFYLSGGCARVYIRCCDARGCQQGAVLIGSVGATVEITDTAGYNDVGSHSGTPPATGVTGNAGFYSYNGPYHITIGGGTVTQIFINGHLTPFIAGSFSLRSTDTFSITYSVVPNFWFEGL